MARIYFDKDIEYEIIKDKTVAVIGYGSQGRAQALNMRDSGLNVLVGLRPRGKSWERAVGDGFSPLPIEEAAERGDIIHILLPDMVQPQVYERHIEKHMANGKTLSFSHGFNIHYGLIKPPEGVDVIMVAPKSPGARVRETYEAGSGVPALIAVYRDSSGNAKRISLEMGKAIGCARAGLIETTFAEETETDIIGEQTVLVGGLIELIKDGFEVLVEAGYQPEVAYFEVLNEAKLIMDMIAEGGFMKMLRAVSDTAKYGGLTVGPKVVDKRVKKNMKAVVKNVRSGAFAKEWIRVWKERPEKLRALMRAIERHPIERVGRKIRKLSGLER
ncbi:MAG: ketol-acid reductoisomerase [Candidatus Bathyarchaeia archaeon]